MNLPSPAHHAHPRAAGLAPRSWLLLIAIGAVLATVSLARLHVFAVHQNERDALFLLERLAERMPLEDPSDSGSVRLESSLADPIQRAGLDLRGLLQSPTDDFERLGDLRWLAAGRVLHRHGYLFDLVGTKGAGENTLADFRLRAWPQRHGRTGIAAFAWCSERGLTGDPNRTAQWDGLEGRPEAEDDWPVLPASLRP